MRRNAPTFVILLLVATVLLASATGISDFVASHRLGFEFDPIGDEFVLTAVHPGSYAWEAGARPGDLLISIDGVPVEIDNGHKSDVGRSFVARMANSGALIEHDNSGGSIKPSLAAGMFLSAVAFALSGLAVATRQSLRPERFWYAAFSFLVAGLMILGPAASSNQIRSLVFTGYLLQFLPVAFVGFALTLGSQDLVMGRRKIILALLGVIAVSLNALWTLVNTSLPELFELAIQADQIFLAAGFLGGLGILATRWFTSQSAVLREQLRIMTLGLFVAVMPFALLVSLSASFGRGEIVSAEVLALAALIIPFVTTFAILRHEMMGIRRFIHRGFAYIIVSITIVGFMLLVLPLAQILGILDEVGTSSYILIIITTTIIAPLVPAVRSVAFSFTDKLLYRDFDSHTDLVLGISTAAALAESISEIRDQVGGSLYRSLGARSVSFITLNHSQATRDSIAGESDDSMAKDTSQLVSIAEFDVGKCILISAYPEDGNALISVVARSQNPDETMLLFLGPKKNGESYTAADRAAFETSSNTLASALARLILLDQLRYQARELTIKTSELRQTTSLIIDVGEREKRAAAEFIHDGPLQKVAHVLSEGWRFGMPNEYTQTLRNAVEELRGSSASLSPIELTHLGLVDSLRAMARRTETESDLQVSLTVRGLQPDRDYEEEYELIIYRIVQEALNNAKKHSKAKRVEITLCSHANGTTVCISDDGIGFSGTGYDQESSRGLGLRLIELKAKQNGGYLEIRDTEARGGALIKVVLPPSAEYQRVDTSDRHGDEFVSSATS